MEHTKEHPMTDLDLDAIEARSRHWDHLHRDDPATTLALVAEVRRLRGKLERVERVEQAYRRESAFTLLTAKTRHYAASVSQNIREALGEEA